MADAKNRLVIFKGDDTGGEFGRSLGFRIAVQEGVSLDGCRAEFEFAGIVKNFDAPLVAGETRQIEYTADETASMPLGAGFGIFRVFDAAGKVRTFSNTIPVMVTNCVSRAYPGTSEVTVEIGVVAMSVAWENVSGKPTTLAGYGITDAVTRAALDEEIVSRNAADVVLHSDIRLSESRLARAQSDIISAMVALKNSRPTFGVVEASTTSEASRPYIVMPGTNRYGEHVAIAVRGGMLI